MSSDIIDEIARRLDVRPEDVAPVLDSVVERIRQQVAHYGYARLADLGTFREHDDSIAFEPDSALAETINAGFTGLGELVLEEGHADESGPPSVAGTDTIEEPAAVIEESASADLPESGDPEVEEDDAATGWRESDSSQPSMHRPEGEEGASFEGTGEPSPPVDFEGEAEPAEDSYREGERDLDRDGNLEDETVRERDDSGDVELESEPVAESASVPEGEAEDDSAFEEEPGDVEDPGTYWDEREVTSAEHPLGPESEPPYEEADFSVLGEREDAADEPDDEDEPTISWAPLGTPDEEGTDVPDTPRASDHPPTVRSTWTDEPGDAEAPQDEEEDIALEADAVSEMADQDDAAWPDESRGGTPARAIRPPTRRSKRERDRKPIWIGVGIIVLVAAAAVAYFTLPTTPGGPEEDEVAQTEPAVPPDTAAASAADEAVVDEAPPPPPESTPLRSEDGIDPAEGGYTIVVHSDTNESSAEDFAEPYRTEGFRVGVLPAQQDGVTRYRVGVGQFETLEEATQQRNELAGGDLPADAWVFRI